MGVSRAEQILNSMIDGTPYAEYPQSRLEDLLLQLKEVIEEGGGGSSTHTYSTTEQEVGTWIDGKTIYERTIDLGSNVIPNVNHTWYDTNIDCSYIDKLIFAFTKNGEKWYTSVVDVFIDNNTLKLVNLGAAGVYVRYIIIQYTKVSS